MEPKKQKQKNTEAALQEAAASVASVTFVHLDYVGPDYDKGIEIPGLRGVLIRPREFSPEQIADFTEKYQRYTHWWYPAGK